MKNDTRITVRISDDQREELERIAIRKHYKMSEVVRLAINSYLRKEREDGK